MSDNSCPLVSVCIVTYNHCEFIAKAIQSVLDQDYPRLEVVIADDHSTDGTAEIIRETARRHPGKIKLCLAEENRGITPNCNAGLKQCTGDYICFLGGDDLFLPGRLAAQLAWFRKHPTGSVCGCFVEVFDSATDRTITIVRDRVLLRGGAVGRMIRQPCATPTSAFMFHWGKCRGLMFDSRLPVVSDWLFVIEACARGEYGCVEEVYLRYRRHAGNATAYGATRSYLDDRLIYTDIYTARYLRDYWACRIQRGNIFFQHGKRLAYDGQMRGCVRLMFFSLCEWPFAFRPWAGLVLAGISSSGINAWTVLRDWRHAAWRKAGG